MKNQKGFSPVIIIVVLVLIGVAGYFGYQYLQIYSAKSFDECVKLKSSTFDANETGNFCTTKYGKKFTQPLFSIEKQVLNKAQIEAQIRPALELYFSDNKKYPESLYLLVPKYLIKMPLSSSTDISYSYQVSTDGSDYTVNATLEDGSVYKVNAPSR